MARTLVQALEGIHFPADKSNVIQYAQRQDISARALEHLEQLPDRQFKDMTELFSALPSKRQVRFKVVDPTHQQPKEESSAKPKQETEQANDQPEEQAEDQPSEATSEVPEAENEPKPGSDRQPSPPTWSPPSMSGAPWAQPVGIEQALHMASSWQRLWLDWFNRSLELYGKALPRWPRR